MQHALLKIGGLKPLRTKTELNEFLRRSNCEIATNREFPSEVYLIGTRFIPDILPFSFGMIVIFIPYVTHTDPNTKEVVKENGRQILSDGKPILARVVECMACPMLDTDNETFLEPLWPEQVIAVRYTGLETH
jgi:hypothetical protein